MDWTKVKNVPKYNPMMFTLARHLEGLAKYKWAKRAGIAAKRLSDIEAGNVLATDEEVVALTKANSHVIETFFMQWHEFETDFSKGFGVSVPINYYKFKIFRDVNPPPHCITKRNKTLKIYAYYKTRPRIYRGGPK